MKTSFNDKLEIGAKISIEILKNNGYTYDEAIEYLFYLSKKCELNNCNENTFIINKISLELQEEIDNSIDNNDNDNEELDMDELFNDYDLNFRDIFDDVDDVEDDEGNDLDIDDIRDSLLDYFYVEKYNNDNKLTLLVRNSLIINQINITIYFDENLVTISDDSIIYNVIFNEELKQYHNEIALYIYMLSLKGFFFTYDDSLQMIFSYDGIPDLITKIYGYISLIESIFTKFNFLLDYYNFDKVYKSILLVNCEYDEYLEKNFKSVFYSDLEDNDLLIYASLSELIVVYLLRDEEYTKKEIEALASLKANYKNVIVIADKKEVNESIGNYIDEYLDFQDIDNNQLLYNLILTNYNNISVNREKSLNALKVKRKIEV